MQTNLCATTMADGASIADTITLKRHKLISMLFNDMSIGSGYVVKLSPKGEWDGHAMVDKYYVVVRVTKVVVGFEDVPCPYPHNESGRLGNCVGCDILWKPCNWRPLHANSPSWEGHDLSGNDGSPYPMEDSLLCKENWFDRECDLIGNGGCVAAIGRIKVC